jgi:glycosyltransferase involved in cell wall biosynthesis
LVDEWRRTLPFALETITPSILPNAPRGRDLTVYGERKYAAFSRAFSQASTDAALAQDPATAVVLANDISEGPDFRRLAQAGFPVFTIFHVDVVDYVTSLYFRRWIQPETTVRWYPRIAHLLPKMAALVWAQQEAAVEHSRGLIVPSPRMREVLLRCYPDCPEAKIHVLPWGNWNADAPVDLAAVDALRSELQLSDDEQVILTLSRISPEKGQDLLLESLLYWERNGGFPERPLSLVICGEAAFMQGKRHLHKLRRLAARLRHVRTHFPGHVTGDRKRAFFALADVYAFPSRHESYGLTLLEAMVHGLACVALDTHGARSVLTPSNGVLVRHQDLAGTILHLLGDEALRQSLGASARDAALADPFAQRAAQLAALLLEAVA